jgi:hypothetical protein
MTYRAAIIVKLFVYYQLPVDCNHCEVLSYLTVPYYILQTLQHS